MIKLIEAQNKGVLTRGWSVAHRAVIAGGSTLSIGVDAETIKVLSARNNELYCGIGGKAKFTLLSKPIPANDPELQPTIDPLVHLDPGLADMGAEPMDQA